MINGLVNINGLVVLHVLQSMFEVFDDESSRSVVEAIAPTIDAVGRKNEGIKPGTNSTVKAYGTEDPTNPVGFSAPARAGTLSFEKFQWEVERYAFGHVTISESDMNEAQSVAISLETEWARVYVAQGWDICLDGIAERLADTANYAAANVSTSLVLSPTVDLQSFAQAVKTAFTEAGVRFRPGMVKVIYNRNVANAMQDVLQVIEASMIAGGTQVLRTGISDDAAVEAFWRKLGFEPVLSDDVIERTEGSPEQILSDDLYFVWAEAGRGKAFINLGISADMLGGIGAPMAYPSYNPPGMNMFMQGQYGFALRSNLLGFIYQGVLS